MARPPAARRGLGASGRHAFPQWVSPPLSPAPVPPVLPAKRTVMAPPTTHSIQATLERARMTGSVSSRPNATMLDERKANILRAVVEEYIETAQPVGSGHIAPAVSVSSATVRNDMVALEHEGYLRQPHTSAGRVPTEKGYRYFVDNLERPAQLATAQSQQIRSFFAKAHGELEQMLQDTSRLLSDLTLHTAVVTGPTGETAVIRSVQLVSLAPSVVLLVVVLANGSVEKHTLELDEDAGD